MEISGRTTFVGSTKEDSRRKREKMKNYDCKRNRNRKDIRKRQLKEYNIFDKHDSSQNALKIDILKARKEF